MFDWMPGRWSFGVALLARKKSHLSLAGPFVTPRKNLIYLAAGRILTDQEVIPFRKEGMFRAGAGRNSCCRSQGLKGLGSQASE